MLHQHALVSTKWGDQQVFCLKTLTTRDEQARFCRGLRKSTVTPSQTRDFARGKFTSSAGRGRRRRNILRALHLCNRTGDEITVDKVERITNLIPPSQPHSLSVELLSRSYAELCSRYT